MQKIYTRAPIKRMSILERRDGDERAFFARHWRDVHGGMVSNLPHLFCYIQNHVVEDFSSRLPPLPGDGLVEQLWRNTAEMQRGYNSPVVRDLIEDEVNYLGHGSNYAILAQAALREAPEGGKLVVGLRHGGDTRLADSVAEAASALCADVLRDDVIATIAKPNFLPTPPHAVDMFLHLFCASPREASAAGKALAEAASRAAFNEKAAFGVWRVTTATIVPAPAD